MRNMPHVRQFNQPGARDRLGSFFGELRDITKISSEIDRRAISTQSRMIFLSYDQQCRNLDFGEFVANRLLIDH